MSANSTRQACQQDGDEGPSQFGDEPGLCFRREVVGAWSARVGVAALAAPADKVQTLFNDLHLYPTKTQVFEMLVCARQCARRSGPLTLSFGEFCVFAAELRRTTHKRTLSSKVDHLPRHVAASPELRRKRDIENTSPGLLERLSPQSDLDHSPEVFLGGSCNPTTWRGDIAIPMLEKMGITYFNPQVADWTSELMEIEHNAKQQAKVLLFVLDEETRATAATVEAAYLAASGRDLLLVLKPYRRGQTIAGETITNAEYLELSRARSTLQEVAEKRGLPVFTDVASAVRCARALLRRVPRNGQAQYTYLEPLDSNARPAVAGRIIKLKKAFDSADEAKCGALTIAECTKAVENYVEEIVVEHSKLVELVTTYMSIRLVDNLKNGKKNGYSVRQYDRIVNFELFCSIIAEVMEMSYTDESNNLSKSAQRHSSSQTFLEYISVESPEEALLSQNIENAGSDGVLKSRRKLSEERLKNGSNGKSGPARKLSIFIPKVTVSGNGTLDSSNDSSTPGVLTPHTSKRLDDLPNMLSNADQETKYITDVYLGGSSAELTTWREKIVIPLLEQHNLTYYVPRLNDYGRMFSAPPHTPLGPTFTFDGVSNTQHQKDFHPDTPIRKNLRSAVVLSRTWSLQSPTESPENHLINSYSIPNMPETRSRTKRIEDDCHRSYSRQRSGSDGILRRQNSQEGRSFKHERSPTAVEDNQPEKRPKIITENSVGRANSNPELEGVEIRDKRVGNVSHFAESNNRLSASDFYKVSEDASPLPFKGMYDDRQLDTSRVLFFALSGDSRCMSSMTLAAHHIGYKPKDTVLYVELIEKSDGLSENAIKDYNRGRLYLMDLAKRDGIPVFNKLEDALQCLLKKLKDGS